MLDNATFAHGGCIAELIEAAGVHIIYLPSYSPDFNRIDKCWVWLNRIRKQLRHSNNLRSGDGFPSQIGCVLQQFSNE